MSLLMLFSAFTGSRPATLLADSQESSKDDLYDSDGDTLIDGKPETKARTIRPGTICYGDIDLFLLRNSKNPKRDILMLYEGAGQK